jgi:hypothetical protein
LTSTDRVRLASAVPLRDADGTAVLGSPFTTGNGLLTANDRGICASTAFARLTTNCFIPAAVFVSTNVPTSRSISGFITAGLKTAAIWSSTAV